MRILKKVAAVPGRVISKVAEVTREHARDAVHKVLDKVEGIVGGSDHHLATAHAAPMHAKHIRQLPRHKKPRAERRRARRAAHTANV